MFQRIYNIDNAFLMPSGFDQILSGLIYSLYVSDKKHVAELHLFDLGENAKTPDLDAIPEDDRLPHLRRLFETLYDGTHPLRLALDKLQALDTVRIIEGK